MSNRIVCNYLNYIKPLNDKKKEEQKKEIKKKNNVDNELTEYIEECKKHLIKKGDKNYYVSFTNNKCKTSI